MNQNFNHKKSLGQNFLNNPEVLRRIIFAGELNEKDVVLEIGSGQGVLTEKLLQSPVSFVHAFEIDSRLGIWLQPLQEQHPYRCTIHWCDILKYDLASLSPIPNKVIANIPYNITSDLFWKILTNLAPIGLEKMVILLQKEAAERLTAPVSTKKRGPLSVTLELMGRTKVVMKVSPGSFTPPPKVWSEVICIDLGRNRNLAADPSWRKFISACFAQRRKKLTNNLRSYSFELEKAESALKQLGISSSVRAEELSAAILQSLFNFYLNSTR
jgi:16S rRNA (adenine1518-N6/adenine1519-N6)-dimethyltransferase